MIASELPAYHRPTHAIAVVLTAATFPLIFLGGLVTTHGAGMSVPDWPNSYGYNMFLFPVSQWVGGIFYEHLHRLKGTLVGFLAVMLALQAFGPARDARPRKRLGSAAIVCLGLAIAWGIGVLILERAGVIEQAAARKFQHGFVGFASAGLIIAAAWIARRREPRGWVRWLTVVVLIAVCIQGTFGGLRVEMISLNLAIIHGCFAQAFFALAGVTAVVTSRWWIEARNEAATPQGRAGRQVATLAMACIAAVFLQLAVGATMRHHGAGLAIPDLPLAYGKLLPPTDASGLASVNQYRAWTLEERPVTLWQVWLHFLHRVGAIVVSVLLIGLIAVAWKRWTDRALRRPLVMIALLLVTQFSLGLLTVYYKKPAEVASAHVAVGALLLLTLTVVTARALRLYSSRFGPGAAHPQLPLRARVAATN